jgi:uncharacterized membrane protein
MGSFALVLALVYFDAARLLSRDRERSTAALAFIGVSVTSVTLSIPIELEQNWITLSWAAESVVLTWIGFRIASVRIRQAAFAVLVLCLFRLFAWDAFEPLSQYAPVFNRRVFSFLAAIAAVYLMAMFYRRNLSSTEPWERSVHTGLILLANGVTVFLITQESWAYHEERLRHLALAGREEMSASEFGSTAAAEVRNSRQLSLSLLWSVYSIAAVAAGIFYRYRPIRLFGIALFFVAIVKVFSGRHMDSADAVPSPVVHQSKDACSLQFHSCTSASRRSFLRPPAQPPARKLSHESCKVQKQIPPGHEDTKKHYGVLLISTESLWN